MPAMPSVKKRSSTPWRRLAPALLGCTIGCAVPPPEPAGNVIDAIVLPMLQRSNLPIVRESDLALCRRMAIDLNGLPPTWEEAQAWCLGRTPDEMATHFMERASAPSAPDGSPPYVYINRRWWADRFQYDSSYYPATTFYPFVRDLDATVGELYAGHIDYRTFARRALASPAFARRFGIFDANQDLVQIASQAFRVFLGREALPSEAEDFGGLWRAWSGTAMSEADSQIAYPDCPTIYEGGHRKGCIHVELGLDGARCEGALRAGCQSSLFGGAAVIPSSPRFVRAKALPPADRLAIETPGRLLAARPEFAEAAVDLALRKYLGWWKAGWYRPDYDLPAVRDALARKFVSDGYDLRALEREIVTSQLYVQRAERPADESIGDPVWAFGPTKTLYGEAWLDALGQATGKRVGACEFRYNGYLAAPNLPGYIDPPSFRPGFYAAIARDLGGCPIASAHGDPSGLVPAITRRSALATLCAGAFPPRKGATLDELIDREFIALGSPPSEEERMQVRARLSGDGCDADQWVQCDQPAVADSLCQGLFGSAQFLYY